MNSHLASRQIALALKHCFSFFLRHKNDQTFKTSGLSDFLQAILKKWLTLPVTIGLKLPK